MDARAGCALADDDRIGGWAGAAVDVRNATCRRVLQRRSRKGERCGARRTGEGVVVLIVAGASGASKWAACVCARSRWSVSSLGTRLVRYR
jgi:hypothetical protein